MESIYSSGNDPDSSDAANLRRASKMRHPSSRKPPNSSGVNPYGNSSPKDKAVLVLDEGSPIEAIGSNQHQTISLDRAKRVL